LLRAATGLVGVELAQVNAVIRRQLESDIALIRALGAYIVGGGGKRLRPLLLLLCAKAGAAGGDHNHHDHRDNNRDTGGGDRDRDRDRDRHADNTTTVTTVTNAATGIDNSDADNSAAGDRDRRSDNTGDNTVTNNPTGTDNTVTDNSTVTAVTLAAVIEFIHTATLLHDDVVDASSMRRGRATANHVWGDAASVLVGDFLYSRAFEMMLATDNMEVMRILAATTNAIAEGEVLQLMNARAADTTERDYFDTIHRKTAKLFESAARLGGVAAGRPAAECAALAAFGLRFGAAFQLVDDILDYNAPPADTGKNAGDDLAEGKLTLPLIIALQRADAGQQKVLRRAVAAGAGGGRDAFSAALAIVESTGALDYTMQRAAAEAAAAVESLAGIRASRYKDALVGLADFAVRRRH